jgi:hypothetical protein
MRYTHAMSEKKPVGRPPSGNDRRLVVRVSAAIDAALDARVASLNASPGSSGDHDRASVVRAMLVRELRAELRAVG